MNPVASFRFAAGCALALFTAGCATQPKPSPFEGFFANLENCRDRYAEVDAQVEAAGAQHAAYYRVPGYPYLRTNRLIASFAHEVNDLDTVGGWVRRMRELDQEAREYEFYNLGLQTREVAALRHEFLNCGRGLAGIELADDPAALMALRQAAQPADDYSTLAQTVGLYPLVTPLLKQHVAARNDEILAAHASADPDAQMQTWQVVKTIDPELLPTDLSKTLPDELGFPGLTESGWTALAEANAPVLLTDRRSKISGPGTPIWNGDQVDIDLTRPSAEYFIDFARFGGEPLVRINYFFWFEAPKDGASTLDGLIWRVTLDRQSRPLVLESLHASGRDHQVFPVQPLESRAEAGFWQQSPVFPPITSVAQHPALRISSSEVLVSGVGPAGEHEGATPYSLRHYDDLFLTPVGDQQYRSIFDAEGFLIGEPSPKTPFWLRASGQRRPGALRQYGLHVTTLVGRRHFDDPYLLEDLFVAPEPTRDMALRHRP